MTRLLRLVMLSAIIIAGLFSCKKTRDQLTVQPPSSTPTQSFVQFSVAGIQLTGTQLYALISIQTVSGEEVVSNKKVTLDNIQGTYKTDKIQLEKAGYKLSKFIVLNAVDTALYATPRAGSDKASIVARPLDHSFTISTPGVNNETIQVLKLDQNDSPASYGYTNIDFGFVPFMSVQLKLKIIVGQVVYDNLPGKLVIKATNDQGQLWMREMDLQNGLTPVSIPENYTNYSFEVVKWNQPIVRNLIRSILHTGMIIELETTCPYRRLVEEATYQESMGSFYADSRTEYFYNGYNQLQEIKFYQKSPQVSGLPLTNLYKIIYNDGKPETIYRYAPDNIATGFSSFTYDGANISNAHNKSYDQETGAVYTYTKHGSYNEIVGDYLFGNGYSMKYKMHFVNGNRVYDEAISSTRSSETGNYEYDDNINPKHQLGYPDLYFKNASKNNIMKEQKTYGGAIPQIIPYKFEYVYNAEGYPVELYTSYKGYSTQQHLYRIKTTYTYQ